MGNQNKGKVLFVDDEQPILQALVRATRSLNCDVITANSPVDALTLLENEPFDIVVSDKSMPTMDGHAFLQKVAEAWPETVRIMLTAYTEVDDVLNAINAGRVWGFMKKPWDNAELNIVLKQALEYSHLLAERSLLRRTLEQFNASRKTQFMGFIGRSSVMQTLYQLIEQAAPSSASVFVTGPSGAGKELVADAIHNLSKRKNKPFLCLNCAAIPAELMESEIFGHVKGAFSGALSNRDGAATQAHGGTLFLDELGEMDINLQAKLLRFIQTGTFQKVGSNKVEKVDIRFVSATNRNPLDAISEGKLREDLFYRLNVISIRLPPLNERERDAEHIAHYFLNKFSEQENKVFAGLDDSGKAFVNNFNWPGNVRQLENVIHSAVILNHGPLLSANAIGKQLDLNDAQISTVSKNQFVTSSTLSANKTVPQITDSTKANSSQIPVAETAFAERLPSEHKHSIIPLVDIERAAIEHAISLCEENVVQAASLLEVSPSTLYRKIQQWQK